MSEEEHEGFTFAPPAVNPFGIMTLCAQITADALAETVRDYPFIMFDPFCFGEPFYKMWAALANGPEP